MIYHHQWYTYMREPGESHDQAQILDSTYEKPNLNELSKNQYRLIQEKEENMKDIILKYKAVIHGIVGKIYCQTIQYSFET